MQPSRIHHVGMPVSDLDRSMVAPTGERLELLAVGVRPSAWDDPIAGQAAARSGRPVTRSSPD